MRLTGKSMLAEALIILDLTSISWFMGFLRCINCATNVSLFLRFQVPIKKPMVMTRDKQLRKDAIDVFKRILRYVKIHSHCCNQ